MKELNSIHKSLRKLSQIGTALDTQATAPNIITRTIKFRIGEPVIQQGKYMEWRLPDKLRDELNSFLDSAEVFSNSLLMGELLERWQRDGVGFFSKLREGTSATGKRQRAFGRLQQELVTGKELSVLPDVARAVLGKITGSQGGQIKTFQSLYREAKKRIGSSVRRNQREWENKLESLFVKAGFGKDQGVVPPPAVDFEKLGDSVDGYNTWVANTRRLVNQVLHQQADYTRKEAPLPQRMKGLPGFPGSRIADEAKSVANRAAKRRELAEQLCAFAKGQIEEVSGRIDHLNAREWAKFCRHFRAPRWTWRDNENAKNASDKSSRPKSISQMFAIRLQHVRRTYLRKSAPGGRRKPADIVRTLLADVFRSDSSRPGVATKLLRHLAGDSRRNWWHDDPAFRKLLELSNQVVVFAAYPLVLKGRTAEYLKIETKRREFYGDARGLLTPPRPRSFAYRITGFSLNDSNQPQYRALLGFNDSDTGSRKWVLVFRFGPQTARVLSESEAPKADEHTDLERSGWKTFVKVKSDSDKLLRYSMHRCVDIWWPKDESKRAVVIPLLTGDFAARKFMHHFDYGLSKDAGWLLGSAEIVREVPWRYVPPGAKNIAGEDCWVHDKQKADFFVTVSMMRATPVRAIQPAVLTGVDCGEAVPATYAKVSLDGRRFVNESRLAELNAAMAAWLRVNGQRPPRERDPAPVENWENDPQDNFGFCEPKFRQLQYADREEKSRQQRVKGGFTGSLRSRERCRQGFEPSLA